MLQLRDGVDDLGDVVGDSSDPCRRHDVQVAHIRVKAPLVFARQFSRRNFRFARSGDYLVVDVGDPQREVDGDARAVDEDSADYIETHVSARVAEMRVVVDGRAARVPGQMRPTYRYSLFPATPYTTSNGTTRTRHQGVSCADYVPATATPQHIARYSGYGHHRCRFGYWLTCAMLMPMLIAIRLVVLGNLRCAIMYTCHGVSEDQFGGVPVLGRSKLNQQRSVLESFRAKSDRGVTGGARG